MTLKLNIIIPLSILFVINSQSQALQIRSAPTESKYFWPNGKIYFKMDRNSFTQIEEETIQSAMNTIMMNSKVQFIELDENAYDLKNIDYLHILVGSFCGSKVGRRGGEQFLFINPKKCLKKGTILHELMHTLGFEHEQTRYDRDNYIIIHWDNINPEKRSQFEKKGLFTTRFGSYDYNSIMHYSANASSSNGNCTISTLDGSLIGQRDNLSQTDIYGLWRAYGE